jgi:hypothetical protein
LNVNTLSFNDVSYKLQSNKQNFKNQKVIKIKTGNKMRLIILNYPKERIKETCFKEHQGWCEKRGPV